MSKKRRDKDFLWDIKEAMEMVEQYTTGLTFRKFTNDRKTQDAVVRNLEIIGEAAKKYFEGIKEKISTSALEKISGFER